MFKIGLEREEFCVAANEEIVLVPKNSGIPHDGCGWLIEYRSRACTDIVEAMFSLDAEEYRTKTLLRQHNLRGERSPVMKPSKDVRLSARRRFIKSKVRFNNLYGHKSHRNTMTEAIAAVHVSVTFSNEAKHGGRVNTLWDFADFIQYMDEEFKNEIKDTKRRPGFYEIKADGRFEYRSLPNNVDPVKLMHRINAYKFKH